MDDQFLNELRRDPDEKFSRELRERLRAADAPRRLRTMRAAPALAFGLAAAVVTALFAFPTVRASAQSMLDLFRVRKFAAVRFDDARAEKLRSLADNKAFMVFDEHEKLQDPGPPKQYATLEEGAAAAGIVARRPSFLPDGLIADTIMVEGSSAGRVSVNESKLRALLDALNLHDVSVPGGLDGQVVEVRKPPALIQQFHGGRYKAALAQSISPEMKVPAGIDIARLAEVGLRILGVDAGEARRLAQATDWRTTLLVPVPMNASTFRQITVRGQPGLMVTSSAESGADGRRRRDGTIVLWTDDDRVFGLVGNLAPDDMLQMAESVQ